MNKCILLGQVLENPKLTFVKKHPICSFDVAVADSMGNISYFPVQFVGSKAKEVYTQVVKSSELHLQGELAQRRGSLNSVQVRVIGSNFELIEQSNSKFVRFKKGLHFELVSLKAKIKSFFISKLVRKEVKHV